jgi:hypothetical protein
MKSFAYPLAILIVAATGMASTASAGGAAEDLHQIKARVDTNMAEKQQLRAVNAPPADAREYKDMQKFVRENEQASDGGQQLQFEIQVGTSDLQNAENVR